MNHCKGLVLSFDVDPSFLIGINRLTAILPFTVGSGGIHVSAVQCDQNSVSLKGVITHICYTRKNLFFRELAILVEQLVPAYRKGDRETLAVTAKELLPTLKEKTDVLALLHRTLWKKFVLIRA